jgi:hypothetical protein
MFDQPPEQAAHPAPHYRLPADHLFTPQVDFWEIVCYRADVVGGPFTLRHRDMMGLLSQPTFARARREASHGPAPPLVAVEEEGERHYVLRAQAEGWPDETLRKLRAYLERGWIGQLGRHRHAKWVLNYLLLERQRRMEKTGPRPRTPPPGADRFSLSWMKLKRALEAAKGKKVEYRKLKDGFVLLERLGIVTPLADQPTARLGYAQRFQHRLNVHRLLDVSPRLLRRCQPVEGDPLTLAQAMHYILRFLTHDYSHRKQVRAWPLDWLHGEVEVDLETESHRRVPVRRPDPAGNRGKGRPGPGPARRRGALDAHAPASRPTGPAPGPMPPTRRQAGRAGADHRPADELSARDGASPLCPAAPADRSPPGRAVSGPGGPFRKPPGARQL